MSNKALRKLLRFTGVYVIYYVPLQKFYIGSTIKPICKRIDAHIQELSKNTHHCKRMQELWNLDSNKDNWRVGILFETAPEIQQWTQDLEMLYLTQIPLIKTLNSICNIPNKNFLDNVPGLWQEKITKDLSFLIKGCPPKESITFSKIANVKESKTTKRFKKPIANIKPATYLKLIKKDEAV